jgi:hypothetical protein
MPIKHAIWKVGAQPSPLAKTVLLNEKQLEDMVISVPQILSSEWLLIGSQEQTGLGGRIDLLAIAMNASLVLIELKKNRTPREVVAQALDYASWVEQLTSDKIVQIYQRFSKGGNLNNAFKQHFGKELDEETLNESHQIIIVAAELDDSTERIITYLNARNIAINVLFFQVFQHGTEQLLSRAWLIDPSETQANVIATTKANGEKEPWNGEFYVSFGDTSSRSWEDARQYGFISGGGGSWYSQTLKLLSPGDRVWVKIPKTGYVGVGIVKEAVQSVNDFKIKTPEGERPCLEVLQHAHLYQQHAKDREKAEYFVKVDWLDTVPTKKAIDEVGLFGNQNTVCQPTTPKWRHTVERLKTNFPKWNTKAGG